MQGQHMQRSCGREELGTDRAVRLGSGKEERMGGPGGGGQEGEKNILVKRQLLTKPRRLAVCLGVQSAVLRQEF